MQNAPKAAKLSTLVHCDRTRSSVARNALQEVIWSKRYIPLSSFKDGCILAPEADVLSAQEAAKKRISASLWRCEVCGKMFESSHFLNKHLARRHPHLHSIGTVCFADLCAVVVPCKSVPDPPVSTHLLTDPVPSRTPLRQPSPCHDATERRARRSACVHALIKCLGGRNSPAIIEHRAYLESQLCDAALTAECSTKRRTALSHPMSTPHIYALTWLAFLVLVAIVFPFALVHVRRMQLQRKGSFRSIMHRKHCAQF